MSLESQAAVAGPDPHGLLILVPIYDDWEAARLLLADLHRVLATANLEADVLLVDDGSTAVPPDDLVPAALSEEASIPDSGRAAGIGSLRLLTLRRNVGHQRAIAIGLAYVEAHLPCRAVVVMDGDGEDAPSDVPRLVRRLTETGDRSVVFAERARRSENAVFQVGYYVYRKMHLALTGIRVRVGNFSVVPWVQLRRLVVVSDLWNHFAAAIYRARIPFETVPCERAKRLSGTPKMNLVSLVTHGLSAMSVFGDRIGTRMLIASSVLMLAIFSGLVTITLVVTFTDVTTAGWEVYAAGLFLMVLLQALLFSLVFVFIILASRNMSGFIPARDHVLFVDGVQVLTAAGPQNR